MSRQNASVLCRSFDIFERGINSGHLLASWWALRLGNPPAESPRRAPSAKPHLLLFAWHFPPAINGGVYRPHSLAKYAAKAGWDVTVVSGPLEETESAAGVDLLKSLPPPVRVFRAPRAPTPSYRMIPKSGDGCFPEIITGFQTSAAACRQNPPSVVVASGPPFHTFISAYFAAKRFRAPLVLEYRDEWSVHTPHFVEATAFDKKWERRLLRSASAVIFVTEATRDLYLASIPSLDAGKCAVVPNGWDPDDFRDVPTASAHEPPQNRSRFAISFVGTIGLHNDPSEFVARFQEVTAHCPSLRDRLLVRFVGPKITDRGRRVLASFQQQFQDSMELVDGVAKAEAVAEMRRTGALLLLLDPFYNTSIPGKLYEYLAAGAPILVFGDTGVAADLVRRLGAGIVVPAGDSSALQSAFERLSIESREQWDTPERKAWVAKHTRDALAMRLLRLLGGVQPPVVGVTGRGHSELSPALRSADH